MDVFRGLKVLLVLSVFSNISCTTESGETIFPHPTEECSGTAVESQFLVHWKSGKVTLEKGLNRKQFIKDFVEKNKEALEFVEHDQMVQVEPVDETLFHSQADYTQTSWSIDNINVLSAWDSQILGEGIIVAVVDSGLDTTHPQLSEQIYKNPGEDGLDNFGQDKRHNGIDDDGNGYVDDYTGYDFVNDSPKVEDTSDHGTHVSGIIAASHDADKFSLAKGVAPRAKILPLDFIGESGFGKTSDAIKAINYAVQSGAQVINASWGGGPCSKSLESTIQELEKENIVFVNAAGNRSLNIDQYIEFPASYNLPSQITVGSISLSGQMASFSNYGDKNVHLFAPGFEIYSTVPGGSVKPMNGTSMAAPFVSGTAALLLSAYPSASAMQVKQAIMEGASKDSLYRNATQGRLNIAEALKYLNTIINQ